MKKIITLIMISILFLPTLIFAQGGSGNPGGSGTPNNQNCPGDVCLENPLGSTTNPASVINNVIQGILGITGVIALIAFVAGGLVWMTSGGNPEKVKKGKDIMVWAVLGLFIIFSSYSILKYVFDVIA